MFPTFLRSRSQRYASGIFGRGTFKARSSQRDAATDRARIDSIVSAIGGALDSAEREQAGLKQRLNDVVARASILVGNGADEYLDREAQEARSLDFFDSEIFRAESRIKELATMLSDLKFLKAATLARFPQQVENLSDPASRGSAFEKTS